MVEQRKILNLPSPLLDERVQAGLRGDFKRGQEIADHLERVSPDCHRAAFNRAWYEMRQGRLNSGLKLLDRGRWERAFGDQPLPTHKAAADVYHDFWVPGMSAGHVLGVEYDSLPNAPYLKPDPAYVAKWGPVVDRRFPKGAIKLGLRFYGNPQFEHEQFWRFQPFGSSGRPALELGTLKRRWKSSTDGGDHE